MSLKIAVPKSTTKSERRVAASPETVKKLTALGCEVRIEKNAGHEAAFTDDMFKDAGAKMVASAKEACKGADIIACVQAPLEKEIAMIPKGALVTGIMSPYKNEKTIKDLAKAGVNSCAMELMPRITRAQSMDVLSSQSNLAGYKAVLDATEYFARAFPMMMTAAGTVAPARVFVMGVGVAGLQAIATARRLGAIVSATDVRPATKEQVESLGATFVAVEDDEFKQAETAGGYAKEMSKAYQKKQQTLVEETIAKQDIVITTALIPGRPAPKLITEKMVKSMKPGSVIVDLAVEMGGNCELSQLGKVVDKHNVRIIGHDNVPSRVATDASALYAKNILNFLTLLIDSETKKLAIDWEDEIMTGVTLTQGGKVVHPLFTAKKTAAPKKAPAKKTAAKKPAAKKTPAKKAAPKKTTTKKAAVKKTAAKKTATKK